MIQSIFILLCIISAVCSPASAQQQFYHASWYNSSDCTASTLQSSQYGISGMSCVNDHANSTNYKITCLPTSGWSAVEYEYDQLCQNQHAVSSGYTGSNTTVTGNCIQSILSGHYMQVDCGLASTSATLSPSTTSLSGSSIAHFAQLSNMLNNVGQAGLANGTTLLITVPVSNATQFNTTDIGAQVYNDTNGTITSYTSMVPAINLTTVNSTFVSLLSYNNLTTAIYTDQSNITSDNTSSLLFYQYLTLPGANQSLHANISRITTLINNTSVTPFSVFNSTTLTNDTTVVDEVVKLYVQAAVPTVNCTLQTVIAYIPTYNVTAPVVYQMFSQHNATHVVANVTQGIATTNLLTLLLGLIIA